MWKIKQLKARHALILKAKKRYGIDINAWQAKQNISEREAPQSILQY